MKIQDLSIWESFYLVAKHRSFTKAARCLDLGVPSLSKKISVLEETLGARLFHRSTRTVSLTQDGLALIGNVSTLLDDLSDLEGRFDKKETLSGAIRITTLSSIAYRWLPKVLVEFSKTHPHVKLDIQIADHIVDMIGNGIDVAIRVQIPKEADFIYRPLVKNHLVFCASPGYLRKNTKPLKHPRDLRNHQVLILPPYDACRFDRSEETVGSYLEDSKIKTDSGLYLTELALTDAGIALRSYWDVAPLIRKGKLIQVLENHPVEPFGSVYVVTPTRRSVSPRVRAFVDFMLTKAGELEIP